MNRAVDQIVLFLFSFTSLLIVKADYVYVTAMLIAVICSSVSYFNSSKRFHISCVAIYLCSGCLFPALYLFLPLIVYIPSASILLLFLTSAAGVLLCFLFLDSTALFFLMLFGCTLALLLSVHTAKYELLEKNFKQTRDDSTESNILLKEKNQALLDKQDYEIYTATLCERNRIAREIHDNVGHMLSRALLMTGALKTIHQDPALADSLNLLSETLDDAMSSIRSSVHDLHDQSINLSETLQGLVDAFTFCKIDLEYDMGYDLPRNIKYSFISIVKEALNNILRHSNATAVQITVREHPALYQLRIEDNGNVSEPIFENGLGVINMKDRIASLNGTIQLNTKHGFCIFITIPKGGTLYEHTNH